MSMRNVKEHGDNEDRSGIVRSGKLSERSRFETVSSRSTLPYSCLCEGIFKGEKLNLAQLSATRRSQDTFRGKISE